MKFELSDDTVLKLSAIGTSAYAAHAWIAPSHFQNTYLEKEVSHSDPTARWMGMGMGCTSAATMTVAISEDSPKAKKNMLKTAGTCWTVAALQNLVNAENGVQKKDISYSSAAGQALMAALCLWRGFKNDEDDD